MQRKTKNPILAELRQIRERMFEEAGGTMNGLVELIREDMKRIRFEPAPSKPTRKRTKTEKA